jgi:hypothetical protein
MRRWAEAWLTPARAAQTAMLATVFVQVEKQVQRGSLFRRVVCERGLLLLPPFLLGRVPLNLLYLSS